MADALELTYSIIPEDALIEPDLIVVDTSDVAVVDEIADSTVTVSVDTPSGDTPTDGTPSAPSAPTTDETVKTSTGFSSSSSDGEDFSSFLTSLATLQESIQNIVSQGLPPLEIEGLPPIDIDPGSLVLTVEAPTAAVCATSCKVRHLLRE